VSQTYPSPFHILAHLSKLAAMLEAGDRANAERTRLNRNSSPYVFPLPPAAHYTDRAMDLWDAAKATMVRRGIDLPTAQWTGDRMELAADRPSELPEESYPAGEPLGGG
jgi:hypothetical protein